MKSRKLSRRRKKTRFESLLRVATGIVNERGFGIDERTRAHRSRHALRALMLAARAAVPYDRFDEFSLWLKRQHIFRSAVYAPIPIGFDNLDRFVKSTAVPLSDELAWLSARFESIDTQLSDYIERKARIERAIWLDQSDVAFRECEELESVFGSSMWLIKTKLALLQRYRGLEKQKEYASSIKAILSRGFPHAVTHFASMRNEPGVTEKAYQSSVDRTLRSSQLDQETKTYLEYKLAARFPRTEEAIASILRVEQNHSDIDVYETYIDVCANLSANREIHSLPNTTKLAARIRDPRLRIIAEYDSKQDIFEVALTRSPSTISLLSGRIDSAVRNARRSIKAWRGLVWERYMLAYALGSKNRSIDRYASNDISSTVESSLLGVANRSSTYELDLARLSKLCINFGSFDSFAALGAIVECDTGDPLWINDVRWARALLFCSFNEARDGVVLRGCGLDEPHERSGGLVAEFELMRAAFQLPVNRIDPEHVASIVSLSRSVNRPIAVRAINLLSRVRSDQGDFPGALDCLSRAASEIEAPLACIEVPNQLCLATWTDVQRGASSPSIPIGLYVVSQRKHGMSALIRFALKRYLSMNGIDRPSSIDVDTIDVASKRTIAYLLENVCTNEHIDQLNALRTSASVAEERIEICRKLEFLKPRDSQKYEREIIETSRNMLLAEGVKLVDGTRIHVDAPAIKRSIRSRIEDQFNRYRSLAAAGEAFSFDLEATIKQFYKSAANTHSGLAIPKSEAAELLVSMCEAIRVEFLSDPLNGLDAYLSRRIRHGSVVGQLRSPVELRRLVTDRRDDGSYVINQHWASRVSTLSGHSRQEVLKYLANFSREFDDELIRIKDKVLHIRSRERPSAAFFLPLTAQLIFTLKTWIERALSIDEFMDAAINVMWFFTGPSLEEVKRMLQVEVKGKFDNLFHGLQLYVSDKCIACSAYNAMAMEVAQCAEEVRREIDSVTSWFDRTEAAALERSFTCEEAVAIAVRSVSLTNKTYRPEVLTDHSNDKALYSNIVPLISEVIHVALSNARNHSGCQEASRVSISTDVDTQDHLVTIEVINNSYLGARRSEVEATINELRERAKAGAFTNAVSREGRSGLLKLAALVSSGSRGSIDFWLDDNENFHLRVGIPLINVDDVVGADEVKPQ